MNIRCLQSMLIVFSFLLTTVLAAQAKPQAIGSITSLSGDVHIKATHKKRWRTARPGMTVYFGDTVRTLEDSHGIITLSDDSIVKIHPNSHVALNTIVSPVEEKNTILLFFGRIWNKIAKKALRKKVFEVQTPTAVCGVRGTEFETASYEDGTVIVVVNAGRVEVDSEVSAKTLAANQGTELSFDTREVEAIPDLKPDWRQKERASRERLFSDGRKYGGQVRREIDRRNAHLKKLVAASAERKRQREELRSAAASAKAAGDEAGYQALLSKLEAVDEELKALNRRIAFYGRRLACHFGLFSRYGELAKDPLLSPEFNGREFILQELDDIAMIQAEFDALIEEGMKLSMEDMEDMMQDMRDRMKEYKDNREGSDPFTELD